MVILDTHAFIWLNLTPERLSSEEMNAISNSPRLGISALGFYEALVAVQTQRVETSGNPEETVEAWVKLSGVEVIKVTTEIVRAARTLPFIHQDPMDRIIASTAHVDRWPLVTSDGNLVCLEWLTTIRATK